ncbi:hypothetical protein [Maribacter sp. R86514]|uniref:hypothetical protein n=1 Tax=Maribacter sp. R86514 TaxID=3093854 RepID=UPI0037CBC473
MKSFIKKLLMFFGVFTGLLLVFLFCWFQYYSFPPPNVSNSISFNAKALYIKNKFSKENVDILAIGSSMSLNNINSNVIAKTYGNQQYLNASSWGLNMEETFNLLKIYSKKYHPETVVISSNFGDFQASYQTIKFNYTEEYLLGNNLIKYLKNSNLSQLILDSRLLGLYKNSNTMYQSLKFDTYGGVNYPLSNFQINDKRWKGEKLINEEIDLIQYTYLDSISKLCSSNSMKLIFVQSPFREMYYSKLSKQELAILNNHTSKIENILLDNDAIFVNSLDKTWQESLFVDYNHLNEKGSRLYTEFFLKNLKPTNIKLTAE